MCEVKRCMSNNHDYFLKKYRGNQRMGQRIIYLDTPGSLIKTYIICYIH